MYKAIIFDCDGTLLDTKIMIQLLYEGYQKFYPKRHKKTYEDFIPCYFFTNMQTKEYLQIPDDEYQAFIHTCFGDEDHLMKMTKPFVGIKEMILELSKRNFILGINTSRIHEHMDSVQNQLTQEVYNKFDYIITSQDVKHPKPAPDSMYKIQELCKCDMSEILYIGDSDNDALCAKAAGCDFALAGWGLVDKNPPNAKYVLTKVEDILTILT